MGENEKARMRRIENRGWQIENRGARIRIEDGRVDRGMVTREIKQKLN